MLGQRPADSGADPRAGRSAQHKTANHERRWLVTRVVKMAQPQPRDRSQES
jgi:hypothetical protein